VDLPFEPVRSADLFLSFEGRLERERWLGAAAFFVAIVIATYAVTWLLTWLGWISAGSRDGLRAFVQVTLLVPWLTLDWKRFHDLGHSGVWAVICPSLILFSLVWKRPAMADRIGAPHELVATGLDWLQLAVAVWLAYALAYRRGTEGPNRFGPDPRAGRALG
jgi:uncharacterized membrane protein YhaH (DUF805 family)